MLGRSSSSIMSTGMPPRRVWEEEVMPAYSEQAPVCDLHAREALEQRDRLREGGVGRARVVALADVAAERVRGRVDAPREARPGRLQGGADRLAPRLRRVRVARAPHHQQRAADLTGARE